MKVNVWKDTEGEIRHMVPFTNRETCGKECDWQFLGTAELTLEVPKKEVEKVVKWADTDIIPPDAYDITVHYKVKE